MRAVVQRVTRASVTVDGVVVGAIDRPGLVALVGVTPGDGAAQVELVARKIAELRILRDEQCAVDVGAPVLVVSQFTLYADTRKGRRPTWNAAAPGPVAQPLVDAVVDALRARGLEVATGVFGADMAVELVNDGPGDHPAGVGAGGLGARRRRHRTPSPPRSAAAPIQPTRTGLLRGRDGTYRTRRRAEVCIGPSRIAGNG